MKYNWLFPILFLAASAHGQTNLDSLWNIWHDQNQQDTTRLQALYDICDDRARSQPDSVLVWSDSMLEFAKEGGLKKYVAGALFQQGLAYSHKRDLGKTSNLYKESLQLYEEIGYKFGIATVLSYTAGLRFYQGDFHKAIEVGKRTMDISKELNDKNLSAVVAMVIGQSYEQLGNLPMAVQIFEHGLKDAEKSGNTRALAYHLHELADFYLAQGDFEKSDDYHQRSLKAYKLIDDKSGIAELLGHLASIQLTEGDYQTALDGFNHTIQLYEKIGAKAKVGENLVGLAGVYIELGDYKQAKYHLKRAEEIAEGTDYKLLSGQILLKKGQIDQLEGAHYKAINWCEKGLQTFEELDLLNGQKNACKCLYDSYKVLNQWEKGLKYYECYTVLKDSLESDETGKKLLQMEFLRKLLADSLVQEQEKLEIQMTAQQEIVRERARKNLYLAGGILILLLAVIAFSRLKYLQKKKELEKERQLLEYDKLKELDQLKSRFFADISHEFRTPLTLVLGPLENIISRATKKEDIREFSLMKRNAESLLQLINQLLDLSRLEAGKMRLELQKGNIIAFFKSIFFAFESLGESKNISLDFQTDTEHVLLAFDPDKMAQVCKNLLSNAFKFTPPGGVVSFKISIINEEHSRTFLKSEIADTGAGIDAEHLPYIFERFYQSRDTYVQDGIGSGIGLALAKELVELHQGQINVESEKGKGTQFTILLPMVEVASESLPMVESTRARLASVLPVPSHRPGIPETALANEPGASTKPIVLLVEDNADMRVFIHKHLATSFQVIEAFDGQEGLEKAIERIPDLVISDVMMPRMDGLQLCDALKKEERTSHIPIILLSAKADLDSRLAGLDRGADAYLAKPFNRQELLLRTRKLFELRQRLQERYTSMLPPPPAEDKDLQVEDAFVQKAREIVERRLSDIDFDMKQFSLSLMMSHSQLFRKIKALTGKSPSLFIRTIRLNHSKKLLETTAMNVTEVAYEVGFSTPAYFSDTFFEAFGIRPSELRK